MSPAEELTLAAERLEALDRNATTREWWAKGQWWAMDKAMHVVGHGTTGADMVGLTHDPADAAFIAAMRGVAKPLAAWLREDAGTASDEWDHPEAWWLAEYGNSLTLAREVIRATGGVERAA